MTTYIKSNSVNQTSVGDIWVDTNSITNVTPTSVTWESQQNYDLTIQREGKPPLRVAETLEKIMDRLAILEPDFDKMDRYPALREAYDNYKLIEAMLTGNEPNGNS